MRGMHMEQHYSNHHVTSHSRVGLSISVYTTSLGDTIVEITIKQQF